MPFPAGLWLGLLADLGSQRSLTCIQVTFGSLALGQRGFCHGLKTRKETLHSPCENRKELGWKTAAHHTSASRRAGIRSPLSTKPCVVPLPQPWSKMLALPILLTENKYNIIRVEERLDLVNCISILAEFRFLSWKSIRNKTICLITPRSSSLE